MKKLIALSALLLVSGAPLTAGMFTNDTDEENVTFHINVSGNKCYGIQEVVPPRKSVSFSFKDERPDMEADLKEMNHEVRPMDFGVMIENNLSYQLYASLFPAGFIYSSEQIDLIENYTLILKKNENGEFYID